MFTYILRRLFQGLGVFLAVTFLCFIIFQFTGDPIFAMVGKNVTPQQREEIAHRLALDRPLIVQYAIFLKNMAHGDFGVSYRQKLAALPLVLERVPASFELAVTALLISLIVGIGSGCVSGAHPSSFPSRVILAGSLLGVSIPTFLLGLLLILVFAVVLRVLPPFGRGAVVKIAGAWSTGFLTLDGISHLILPSITLAGYYLATLLRLTHGGMMEAMQEDYIRTARASGLPERAVILRHALKNVLIPVVTVAGLEFGELLAFSIVTETIFQWPGTGNLLLTSIYSSDRPVVITYISLVSIIILLINLGVDMIYGYLDPRVTYE